MLLLDLEKASCGCTDHVLETLYKSLADPPDGDIWEPHYDPWQREHVEDVTRRGLAALGAIQTALVGAVGETEPAPLAKADTPWYRWSQHDFDEVSRYLMDKPRAAYTVDDWLLYVDWIIQQYLPAGVIRTEAEYMRVRAQIAGKVQANLEGRTLQPHEIDLLLAVMPKVLGEVPDGTLTRVESEVLHFAVRESANLITALSDKLRAQMKGVILDGIKRITLGDRRGTVAQLQDDLLGAFAPLNRDWRRIAITEAGNAAVVGYLCSLPVGAKVQRLEAYKGACPYCAKINGAVLTVVSDAKEPKNWDTEVWPSKTNVGRSASPRKRIGNVLVQRTDEEMWKIPAGLVHPNCRGRFIKINDLPQNVSPEFKAFMNGLLKQAGLPSV